MGISILLPRAISAFQSLDESLLPECIEVESLAPPESLLGALPEAGLAIVGTRHPQRRSLEWIEAALRGLGGSGLVILSGFARGIDAHAHEMAVRFGLRTLAILGCGLDLDYPRESRALRARILESGGALLSPFPRGTPPYAGNFLRRNAWIAGLSKAVWVVEAAAASGTLNTAAWASRLNRDLYATSCFPGETRFEGNEKLLSQNRPDRYPVAHAFFGPWSLAPSWPALGVLGEESLRAPSPLEGGSTLQLWIQEIRSSHGECHLPALLRKAGQEGMPRELLLPALRREIAEGRVAQEADGRLEIRSQAK